MTRRSPGWRGWPLALVATGAMLAAATGATLAWILATGDEARRDDPVITGTATGQNETHAPSTDSVPSGTETTVLPPASVAFSWEAAGAFVWHETDVEPTLLGRTLRENGFGWVAVRLHDGLEPDPVENDWIMRFRVASGLPVGGWGVLRTAPVREARLADTLVGRYGLDFYIANAEAEYAFTGVDGGDPARSARSTRFVRALASLRPATFPRALSSYCAPTLHDLDWRAWSDAGYAFLPQAYENDFGANAAPSTCVASARAFFAADRIHPTLGVFEGQRGTVPLRRYVGELERSGAVGFSVYLAETRMTSEDWAILGEAIRARRGARLPG